MSGETPEAGENGCGSTACIFDAPSVGVPYPCTCLNDMPSATRIRVRKATYRRKGELARLRAEIERLTELKHIAEDASTVRAQEVERLTRAFKRANLEALESAAECVAMGERAETAERERDEARLEVIDCTEWERTTYADERDAAEDRGWGYLYPEGSPTTGATGGESGGEMMLSIALNFDGLMDDLDRYAFDETGKRVRPKPGAKEALARWADAWLDVSDDAATTGGEQP